MFEDHLTELGYCGAPVCGDVEIITCDGFFSHLSRAVSSPNRSVAGAARTAYKSAMGGVASSALRYGNKGAALIGDVAAQAGVLDVSTGIGAPLESAGASPADVVISRQPYKRGTATDPLGYLTADIAVANRLTNGEISSIHQLKYLAGFRDTSDSRSKVPYKRGTPSDPLGYLTASIISANRLTPSELRSIRNSQFWADHPDQANVIARQAYDNRGKSLFQKVGGAVGSVATFVAKPATGLVKAGVAIGHGANVLATARAYGKTTIQDAAKVAKVAGTVASIMPGIGTAASFALNYSASVASAAVVGKNLYNAAKHAAIESVLNSIPGGQLTRELITIVGSVAVKGIEGQNLLRSARNELIAAAIAQVPSDDVQAVLHGAADAAIAGKNVLSGAGAVAIQKALAQIPDNTARAAVEATLHGKPIADVVKGAGASLLARAAASLPTGGVAALVTGMVKVSPEQLHAAANLVLGSSGASPVSRLLPAIGGAALGAVGAARSATSAVATGKVAASLVANGSRDPAHIAAVRTASVVTDNVAGLARVNTAGSQLMTSALKSLPASAAVEQSSGSGGASPASRLLPAIGGVALGAYGAARSAARAIATGKVAAGLVANGSRDPAHIAAVRTASVITNNVAGLANVNTMGSLLVTSAMKSLAA